MDAMEDTNTPLRLPPARMLELGNAAAELLADRLTHLRQRPVARRWSRAELELRLREPVPTAPRDPLDVLRRVATDILPACAATDHPRFFSYVPGPGNYVAAVADFVASGANVFAGHWLVGAGAAQVELVVLDWLRQLTGLPEEAGGILTSGGTQATLVAVHAARAARFGDGEAWRARIYLTDQTHAAIVRGLTYLGFARGQIRRVPTRDDQTMDPGALRTAIAADRAAGAVPFCVIATAGTTSTGAVDPLEDIADLCARGSLWLHVDAAYGGAAVLSARSGHLLAGLERADSIAVDPHKWWFQPYEAGCTLVRDAEVLRHAYALDAEYLTETRGASDPVNLYDYGPQLTRGFRALKIWMTLQTFGLDAVRDAVEHGITLAEHAESLLRARPQWTIVTPAQLGVVTFRPELPGLPAEARDRITRAVAEATLDDGHALVLTTDLGAGPVLRLCTIHPETDRRDLESTVDLLDRILKDRAAAEPTAPRPGRDIPETE
jgi:glutamate/tyrosine decarboxylase-like PLP-dependent enzyme